MTQEELETILRETLDDLRLSRSERKALRARLEAAEIEEDTRRFFRRRAFEIAREVMADAPPEAIVAWLEEVVSALDAPPPTRSAPADVARAHFSPGDECLDCIVGLIREARETLDICVFTITDDRISRELVDAGRRVALRIITDDDKAFDEGSDVFRLQRSGLDVRVDRTPNHMHHKFMVVDRRVLLTGSYNWTRSAANFNHENVLATSEPRLVSEFTLAFDRLWRALA